MPIRDRTSDHRLETSPGRDGRKEPRKSFRKFAAAYVGLLLLLAATLLALVGANEPSLWLPDRKLRQFLFSDFRHSFLEPLICLFAAPHPLVRWERKFGS